MKIVPDTSVIISGILAEKITKDVEIIIPEFVMEELRAQASRGRDIGFKGLDQIIKLRENGFKIVNIGRRQTFEEIQLSKYGRIDALILDVAKKENAVLYTSDIVQAKVAQAQGVVTEYFEPYVKDKQLSIDKILTKDMMSIHIKEGIRISAKKGKPGNFELVKISDEPVDKETIELYIKEIMDFARYEEDAFIEDSSRGSVIIQLKDKRIVIARPPFSEKTEITIVRPITKLTLDDYSLDSELKKRLEDKAEGIIISGPPGSGKSTLAASISEFYQSNQKIVKTMESPRDLQVNPEITQYSKLNKSFENTADLLLLVRPDYTIFDEIRKTTDFKIFSDMRLAGIGMIGVVHATDPINSIQRFIGRVELGIIPHVIDTVIYVKDGKIEKVLYLNLSVRTPTGMTETDLARPLIEVRDFKTGELEYEIYTYGEENVIIPVKSEENSPMKNFAKLYLLKKMRKIDENVEVEIVSDNKISIKIENDLIPRIIGHKGKNIQKLEDSLGVSINVVPKVSSLGSKCDFKTEETGAYVIFNFDINKTGEIANFYIKKEYLFSATVGNNGKIKVSKESEIGEKIISGLMRNVINVFI